MAVLYGADAVYLAGTDFGMRAFAGNFAPDELRQAVDYAHRHGVRVHCTMQRSLSWAPIIMISCRAAAALRDGRNTV